MIRDEELHVTNYVVEHFPHLMTPEEREALGSIVITVKELGEERLAIHTPGKSEPPDYVKALLANGMQALRKNVRDRLIQEWRTEIYKNACTKCGKLPATPKAKQCFWCSHSWRT